MQGRIFFRIMIDNLFVNNAFSKAIIALVNFCNEQNYYHRKELKFLEKMPLNKKDEYNVSKNNKFIFKNQHSSGVKFN